MSIPGPVLRVHISPVTDFAALGRSWRALEAGARRLSFFQSWTWVGCLAEERYDDPVLLQAESEGRLLGMALFNRRRGRLHLAESGNPALDAPFVEHNGPLLGPDGGPEVAAELVSAAWRVPRTRRLVLSGVPPDLAATAGGMTFRVQERLAPFLDLGAVRRASGDLMATLSPNARHQLRRSARHYEARGPFALARAETPVAAVAWLDALVVLHERRWNARGQPGAFATPWLRRFHAALIERALARDELDLLRVTAGEEVIGYLYNFRLRGRISAYQSGFDFGGTGPHGKPGLTCHALAIGRALAAGEEVYDFLAPADRYKTTLAKDVVPLTWVEVVRARSPAGVAARLRHAVQPWVARWRGAGDQP